MAGESSPLPTSSLLLQLMCRSANHPGSLYVSLRPAWPDMEHDNFQGPGRLLAIFNNP